MNGVGRYLRTARHLGAGQIGWRLWHELRVRAYRTAPELFARAWRPDPGARVVPPRLVPPPADLLGAERIVAERWRAGLVEYHGLAGPRDDWRAPGRTRLWRYQRQYHSELVSLAALAAAEPAGPWLDEAAALVRSWREACPPPALDAWEPYPVARRILNWSLAAALAPDLSAMLAPVLAPQLRFLAAHLEHHLRGNHLLCDGAALVAGGLVLEGGEAFARRGERLLAEELVRQVLSDGGYSERTPQYHSLVLQDVLLALGLARGQGLSLAPAIGRSAAAMASWLARVRRLDGSLPALNDTAPDATPPAGGTLALARALGLWSGAADGWLARAFGGGEPDAAETAPHGDVELPDTGWSLVREGAHELLFEHGPIGPGEQPGHGHSDALSFELTWGGVPLVLDSGVTTYEAGPVRDFERSARAHASVTVGGEGPDELWAAFRVGARGRVRGGLVRCLPHGARLLRGELRAARWSHVRAVVYWPDRALLVFDEVRAHPMAQVLSRLPLGPAASYSDGRIAAGEVSLRLEVIRGRVAGVVRGTTDPRDGWISEGFGRARPRVTVLLQPNERGLSVYAIIDGAISVALDANCCTIQAGDDCERLALGDDGLPA